jgi:hypothetical protein
MGPRLRNGTGRAARRVRGAAASAPGTSVWLLLLAVSALQYAHLPPPERRVLLRVDSTNLAELSHHPLTVLVLSALWVPPAALAGYAVLFAAVHAPVERRLRTARWLLVVAAAHVGATLAAEGLLRLAVRGGAGRHVVDIGVSYGLAGAAGVLACRFRGRWRPAYAAALLACAAGRAAATGDLADVGHLVALGIGLAFLPLVPRWTGTAAAPDPAAPDPGAAPAPDPPTGWPD